MGTILTSLVITTYNRAALLGEALESVAQSQIDDPARVEVIVVDNNSTDETHRAIGEIRTRGFPFNLRYVLEQHQGLSHARNRGADEAAGTYVAYMDDDQHIEKHYLCRIEAVFRDTRAACVGGPIHYHNNGELPDWVPPLLENVGQVWNGDERRMLGPANGRLGGGNMVFDRHDLLSVGKFDTKLGRIGNTLLAGEEDELQDRLHAAGKRVAYDPGLIQYHRLDPARLTKRFWRRHQFDRGRTLWRMKSLKADMSSYPTFLGAPRWFWLCLLTRDIPRVVWPLMKLDMTQGFYRELDVWSRLGQIREARHASSSKTKA